MFSENSPAGQTPQKVEPGWVRMKQQDICLLKMHIRPCLHPSFWDPSCFPLKKSLAEAIKYYYIEHLWPKNNPSESYATCQALVFLLVMEGEAMK